MANSIEPVLSNVLQSSSDEVVTEITERDISLVKETSKSVSDILHIPEAVKDSKFAVVCSRKASNASSRIALKGVTYSSLEFSTHIRRLIDFSTPEGILNGFAHISGMLPNRMAIGKICVKGNFEEDEAPETTKKPRRSFKRNANAGERTVVKEWTESEEKKDDTEKRVEQLHRILQELHRRGHEVVDFFEFVIEPSSFSETAENIFYVGFLLDRPLAKLGLDPDGLPCLTYIPHGTADSAEDDDEHSTVDTSSFTTLLNLRHDVWRGIIETFDIKKSIIKQLLE